MKTKQFLASAAKAAFALAVVVMMSAVFTACSKDNDDDNPPAPKTQVVALDGVEKPIVNAEYIDEKDGNYSLYLYLSADRKERVIITLNKDLHMTGSPVKLTEKEKKHTGKWYWGVEYDKPDGTILIDTWGNPSEDDYPVFTTGTLTISGSPESTINIKLENGLVKGKDGKEYSLTISYSGPMTEKKKKKK
ncbi:hypothetical protein [Segatella maculosa]|uniref:Lipocalin-like domain-containing protein n=1 Tax=Segatella maculosa OT 289 TaxID=999422 RepID=H1HNM2_9BACT|nr:hypothetical protein [Segatella maculosa]EHO68901.1 hypothetical protein HMPREF9944_01766 [Segatella maculosa OT 289]